MPKNVYEQYDIDDIFDADVTDDAGNPYPTDYFDPDDLNDRGKLTDDRDNEFSPLAGNREVVEGKCNAELRWSETRYGETRYCSRDTNEFIASDVDPDHPFCRTHRQKADLAMRAKELLQHGLTAKTIEHLYRYLDPYQKVLAHGVKESLFADSRFEFAPETEIREFDFGEADVAPTVPPECIVENTEDTFVIELDVPYATEYPDRALHLWLAAIDTIKMINVQAKIAEAGMEVESAEYAEFTTATVPSDDGGEQKSWHTVEEVNEHHLNLAYSRLVKDRKELLAYGGIQIDGETDTTESSGITLTELQTDLNAEPELVNDETEVDKIAKHAGVEPSDE